MDRSSNRVNISEKNIPEVITTIRKMNAIRTEVRLRCSHEPIAVQRLIRWRMESQPPDNSSISFGHPWSKFAQRENEFTSYRFVGDETCKSRAISLRNAPTSPRLQLFGPRLSPWLRRYP